MYDYLFSSLNDRNNINKFVLNGGYVNSVSHYFIIGILLITIAFILLWIKTYWISTDALVSNKTCDDSICEVKLNYRINDNFYYKIMTVSNKSSLKNGDTVSILYDVNNFNNIKFHDVDYNMIGIILLIIGGGIIFYQYIYVNNENNDLNKPLFSVSESSDNVKILQKNTY